MFNHITMDSFGSSCPTNWQEIANYLNDIIDSMDGITDEFGDVTTDGREQIDRIWEQYWSDFNSNTLPKNAPLPIIE